MSSLESEARLWTLRQNNQDCHKTLIKQVFGSEYTKPAKQQLKASDLFKKPKGQMSFKITEKQVAVNREGNLIEFPQGTYPIGQYQDPFDKVLTGLEAERLYKSGYGVQA